MRDERWVRDREADAQRERRHAEHDGHQIDRARDELRGEHVTKPHGIRSIRLPRELLRAADRSARRAAEVRHAEEQRAEERLGASYPADFFQTPNRAPSIAAQSGDEKRHRDHEKTEAEHPHAGSPELARARDCASRVRAPRAARRADAVSSHVSHESSPVRAPPTSSTNALSSDRAFAQVFERPESVERALLEDRDLLAELLDDLEDVTREQDRRAAFAERREDVFDGAARDGIDAFERLVEKEHVGSVDERGGERDLLLHAEAVVGDDACARRRRDRASRRAPRRARRSRRPRDRTCVRRSGGIAGP